LNPFITDPAIIIKIIIFVRSNCRANKFYAYANLFTGNIDSIFHIKRH